MAWGAAGVRAAMAALSVRCAEQPKYCLSASCIRLRHEEPCGILVDEFAFESEESGPIGSGESVALRVRVLDAGQEDGGVLKVPVAIAGVGLVRGRF